MKLAHFLKNNTKYYGTVSENRIRVIEGDIFGDFNITAKEFGLEDVKILPPVHPSKVICAGLNYLDHAKEMNLKVPDEPVIFLKPATSVIGFGDEIIYPSSAAQLDYEAELAVIIKDKIKDIEAKDSLKYILGYTCLNDVTARDLQKKDGQWTRAKSFDTFCPIGPFIVNEINPDNLSIKLFLNGQTMQNSNTKNLIFKVDYLVSFISKIMTLYPGDIISTGTPPGIGRMRIGDTVKVEIEEIGVLENKVTGNRQYH